MIQYLQELVKQASQSLAGKNFPEQAAGELRQNVAQAQQLLANMKLQSAADQNALDGIDRNMQYLQQQVSTIISTSYQGNYRWEQAMAFKKCIRYSGDVAAGVKRPSSLFWVPIRLIPCFALSAHLYKHIQE